MEAETPKPVFMIPVGLFDVGQVVATPGALDATDHAQRLEMLSRHIRGDWGTVSKKDRISNFEALTHGNRIISAYAIDQSKPSRGYGANTLWIITEADRSVTTFLLPSEY